MSFTLNQKQKEQMAEVSANIGIVFLAATVTPLFTSTRIDVSFIFFGCIFFFVFLTFSMLLLK